MPLFPHSCKGDANKPTSLPVPRMTSYCVLSENDAWHHHCYIRVRPLPPQCQRHWHSTSAPPHQAGGVYTYTCELCTQSPRGLGETGRPMPPLLTLRPAGRNPPPSSLLPWHSCTHSAIYSLINTPNPQGRLCPFTRHRAPAHTHRAGAPTARRLPNPRPFTHPSRRSCALTCCLRAQRGTFRRHEGKGFILPEHQPT